MYDIMTDHNYAGKILTFSTAQHNKFTTFCSTDSSDICLLENPDVLAISLENDF